MEEAWTSRERFILHGRRGVDDDLILRVADGWITMVMVNLAMGEGEGMRKEVDGLYEYQVVRYRVLEYFTARSTCVNVTRF